MQQKVQRYDAGSFVLNIDSYHNGELTGRYYHPQQGETGQFQSLMQLLLEIERCMDEIDGPQSFQAMRTFFAPYLMALDSSGVYSPQPGKVATFCLHIRYRRNASWQGTVIWLDEGESCNFRSVLELVTLINSAIESKEMLARYPHSIQEKLIWAE